MNIKSAWIQDGGNNCIRSKPGREFDSRIWWAQPVERKALPEVTSCKVCQGLRMIKDV